MRGCLGREEVWECAGKVKSPLGGSCGVEKGKEKGNVQHKETMPCVEFCFETLYALWMGFTFIALETLPGKLMVQLNRIPKHSVSFIEI